MAGEQIALELTVGRSFIPVGQTDVPLTYMKNGNQYIVIAIGGSGYPAN
jgi:hypothetical protein